MDDSRNKLYCICGHDRFIDTNKIKTSNPPYKVYKCESCGEEINVRQEQEIKRAEVVYI